MLAEGDHIVLLRRPGGGFGLPLVPPARFDDTGATRARGDERQRFRAPGGVEDGDRLAREDARVPAQLDQGDRRVKVRRGGAY